MRTVLPSVGFVPTVKLPSIDLVFACVTTYRSTTAAASSSLRHPVFVFQHFRSTDRRHSSFCAFVTRGRVSKILVIVYSAELQTLLQRFFDDLSTNVERAVAYSMPVHAAKGNFK
jgi:hypothetical protein